MPKLVLKILQGKLRTGYERYEALVKKGDSPLITNGDGGLGKRIDDLIKLNIIKVNHDERTLDVFDARKLFDYGFALASNPKLKTNANKAAIIFALLFKTTEDHNLKQQALQHLSALYAKNELNPIYKKTFLNPSAQDHALTFHEILIHLAQLNKINASTNTAVIANVSSSESSSSDSDSSDSELEEKLPPPLHLPPPAPAIPTMETILNEMHEIISQEKIIYDEDVVKFQAVQKAFFLKEIVELELDEIQKLTKHLMSIQNQEATDHRLDLVRMEVGIVLKHRNSGLGNTPTWTEMFDGLQKILMDKLEVKESKLLSLQSYFDNLNLVSENSSRFFWKYSPNRQTFLDRFIILPNKENKPRL